jgi:hypothetical protein
MFISFNLDSGVEKRYLVRLITLRQPFDSAPRNTQASDSAKMSTARVNVGVAQSVERRTHKPQVTGSIPVADTINIDF